MLWYVGTHAIIAIAHESTALACGDTSISDLHYQRNGVDFCTTAASFSFVFWDTTVYKQIGIAYCLRELVTLCTEMSVRQTMEKVL